MTKRRVYKAAAFAGLFSMILYVYDAFVYGISGLDLRTLPVFAVALSLVAYCVYRFGFALIGRTHRRRYLALASNAAIILTVLTTLLFYIPSMRNGSLLALLYFFLSVSLFVVGWQMYTLRSELGEMAVWYGILQMVNCTGAFLYLFGLLPAMVLDLALYGLGTALFWRLAGGRSLFSKSK